VRTISEEGIRHAGRIEHGAERAVEEVCTQTDAWVGHVANVFASGEDGGRVGAQRERRHR
jgi:hypothetical protein